MSIEEGARGDISEVAVVMGRLRTRGVERRVRRERRAVDFILRSRI